MHGEEVGFEGRLRDALQRYRPLLGGRLVFEDVDPQSPALRDAYRAFSDTSRVVGIPPDLGEWIDLESGRKPMLRLVLDKTSWASLGPTMTSTGHAIATIDLSARESHDGRMVPSEESPSVVAFVGRDRKDVREAARVDGELLAGGTSPEAWKALGRRLGELLGYPPCCVDHFVGLAADAGNDDVIRAIAERSARFFPWINNVSMSVYHPISWFPCRYDCEASARIARTIDDKVFVKVGKKHHRVRRYLSMPRLYFDDRRQLIFEGAIQRNGRVRYGAVHTPFTFAPDRANAMEDWLFRREVVSRFPKVGWFEPRGEETVTGSRGVVETIRWAKPPVWMPFGLSQW